LITGAIDCDVFTTIVAEAVSVRPELLVIFRVSACVAGPNGKLNTEPLLITVPLLLHSRAVIEPVPGVLAELSKFMFILPPAGTE
jgi:hypothetical protein